MTSDFEFKVGEKYANRREEFTVVAIDAPNLRVRFEDGREATLDLNTQARIQRNMLLPPATPEPPPRPPRSSSKAALAAKAKAANAAAAETATRTRRAAGSGGSDGAASSSSRSRAGRVAISSDLTLSQLCAMPREERRDKLAPLLSTPDAFNALIERSIEADSDRFRLFEPEQVVRLQETELQPSRSDPELLLSYAVFQNREWLDQDTQRLLARRYPLLEGGVERYVIDLLAYDTAAQTPIVIETRVKTTGRQWLWEALLEALRNWVGFTRAANLEEALGDHPLTAAPLLGVLAPTSFWSDNVASSLPKISDFPANAALNANLLAALRNWLGVKPLLFQVPDTWIRDADEAGRPSISIVSAF